MWCLMFDGGIEIVWRCLILLGKCGDVLLMIWRRGGEGWTNPGLAGPVYPALLLATLSDQDKDWPHHQPGLPPPLTAQPSFHSCFQNENWKCRAECHPIPGPLIALFNMKSVTDSREIWTSVLLVYYVLQQTEVNQKMWFTIISMVDPGPAVQSLDKT